MNRVDRSEGGASAPAAADAPAGAAVGATAGADSLADAVAGMAVGAVSDARRRDNSRGIAAMLAAVGAFSLMDACLKLLAPHYPAMQVAALRGLASLPIVLVWAGLHGGYGQLFRVRWALQIGRGVLGIGMLAGFTYALRTLPLAEAYAIFFVAPLLITALAVPILGERVDAARWIAIVVGLLGVLIVLRPTGAGMLSLPGLAVLGAAAGYALSAITVRMLARTDSAQATVFWVMATLGLGATLLAWPSWKPIESGHWWFIGGLAITGSLGQWTITEAFRRAEASVIAPLEYTALAWGVALDWFLWHVAPAWITLAGAAVIIASGVFLIRRERTQPDAAQP